MSRLSIFRALNNSRARLGATAMAGALFVASAVIVAGAAWAAQDRYAVKASDGISFGEFKGYDSWQDIAVSQVDDGIKAIVGNPAMMKAYRAGIPGNGHAFPDGAKVAKIEWSKKSNAESPYPVTIPDKLISVAVIEKDSKRFADTSGWGYAVFLYDGKTGTFKADYAGKPDFGKNVCYSCHTGVKAKDYIFTAYPFR